MKMLIENTGYEQFICTFLGILFNCLTELFMNISWFFSFQSKFSAFKNKYEKTFNSDNFDYDSLANSDYVFMRWKEHFLVSFFLTLVQSLNAEFFLKFKQMLIWQCRFGTMTFRLKCHKQTNECCYLHKSFLNSTNKNTHDNS